MSFTTAKSPAEYVKQAKHVELLKLNCCGIKEIHGISQWAYKDPGYVVPMLKDIVKASYDFCAKVDWHDRFLYFKAPPREPFWRYFMFTQAQTPNIGSEMWELRQSYGDKLAHYIRENNLGTVTVSEENLNPNSGNRLKIFIWTFNWTDLKAWYEKNADPQPKPVGDFLNGR